MNQAVISNVYRRTTAESGLSRVPARIVDGVLHPKTGLIRIIHFGEALRAVHAYISEDLIARRPEPIVDLLATAFDRLEVERPGFFPEEFTLYFMSILLGLSDDPKEAHKIRIGSARYIVKSASVLPPDFAPIIADARKLLSSEAVSKERKAVSTTPPCPTPEQAGRTAIRPELRIGVQPIKQDTSIPETAPSRKPSIQTNSDLRTAPEASALSPDNRYRRTTVELRSEAIKSGRDTYFRLGRYQIISLVATIAFVSFLLIVGSKGPAPLEGFVQGATDIPTRDSKP